MSKTVTKIQCAKDQGSGVETDALQDPLSSLSQLRSILDGSGQSSGSTQTSNVVLSTFEQLVAEHRGMADELISVYEQLGIIFEVTRKLCTVQGEDEVLGLFVHSLRRSFSGKEVLLARRGRNDQWFCTALSNQRLDEDFQAAICGALMSTCIGRGARTVVVHLEPAGQCPTGDALISPVYSGDLLVCALVILRLDPPASPVESAVFRASDMSLVESLTTFCGDLIRNHRLVAEMREMSIAMVRSLVSAVDQKDEYTSCHSLRVGYYATTLGRLLQLPEPQLQMLQWAALLHDVGKIGIRDEVLKKHGKLTAEEFEHIKEHPTRSHRVVQQVPQLAGSRDGILHHHERFDGSGYPAGLKGEAIPLQARIIQIADIFDALTSTRSYRPAYSWETALEILKEEAGKSVDPKLQTLFDHHIRQVMRESPDAWSKMLEKANHFAFGDEERAGTCISFPVFQPPHGDKS